MAAIHGINGFLRVTELEREHEQLAEELAQLLEQLDSTDTAALPDFGARVRVALSDRDDVWKRAVECLELKTPG